MILGQLPVANKKNIVVQYISSPKPLQMWLFLKYIDTKSGITFHKLYFPFSNKQTKFFGFYFMILIDISDLRKKVLIFYSKTVRDIKTT